MASSRAALPDPARPDARGQVTTDVAIIGAGIAGLFAAVTLPADLRVVIIDKGRPSHPSGSSPWAQGGMAVAVGPDDSPALHAADTIAAGDGLCDPQAVAVLTDEAPGRLDQLIGLGAEFDRRDPSRPALAANLHLAREGAQSAARSVHRADATGAEMVRVLRRAAAPRVTRLEGTVTRLLQSDGRVVGATVLDGRRAVEVRAGAVLVATGGCGGLYAATTNQDHATGDGVALAHHAGAAVRDLAFVQFHPTGLATEGSWRFLLTEALRGAGATLHDDDGRRFMLDRHPDAELAPRHVVASGILAQPGGRAWLDATHLTAEQLADEFPTVVAGAREHGWDLGTQRVPVTPAAHYMVGGVRTDLHGRTSVDGLWAAGEVASTGLHGANRMAGNSLAEALVFGARAAESIAAEHREPPAATAAVEQPPPGSLDAERLTDIRGRLRAGMWRGAGPVRDATSLAGAAEELAKLASELGDADDDPEAAELRLGCDTARLIVTEALARPETRGGHVRTDHPDRLADLDGIHLEHTAR